MTARLWNLEAIGSQLGDCYKELSPIKPIRSYSSVFRQEGYPLAAKTSAAIAYSRALKANDGVQIEALMKAQSLFNEAESAGIWSASQLSADNSAAKEKTALQIIEILEFCHKRRYLIEAKVAQEMETEGK